MSKEFPNFQSPSFQSSRPSTVLPPGWTWTTLPALIPPDGVFIDGDWVESKDQDAEGGVRLIQLADVGDGMYRNRSHRHLTHQKAQKLRCTFLEVGDVLIARMPDPLGRACLFPGDSKPCVTVVDVCIVRTGKYGVDNRWLMYAVNSPQFRASIAAEQSGSTRKRISRGNLAKLELPLPPLPEQRRIVAKIEELFSKLDAGVEALKKVKAELKRYRQAVLKFAFEGKLTEEWRKKQLEIAELENGKLNIAESESGKSKIAELESGKLENEKMQISKFPDFQISNLPFEPASVLLERIKEERKKKLGSKYKELPPLDTSELPDLPEGWAWARLGEILSIRNGFAFKSSDYQEHGVLLIRQTNLGQDRVNLDNAVYLPNRFLDQYADFKIDKGDLLLGMSGSIGKLCVYNLDTPALQNQRTGLVLFYLEELKGYVRYFFETLQIQFSTLAKGIAVQNISAKQIESCVIPLPPIVEQHCIVSEIERRFSVADEVEKVVDQSLKQAERLRQSILKRAFEGKLVEQDPTDPPAIQLLEEIRKQKENAAAPTRKGQHSLRRASQSASVSVERIKKEKEKQTAKVAKKRKGK